MKKILTLAFAFAAINFSANAQVDRMDRSSKNKMEHKGNHDKVSQLNLTQEQKEKLKAQKEAMKIQRDAIKNSSASEETKKQQMQELKEKQKQQIKQILTAEQQKQLKENMSHRSHDGKMKDRKVAGKDMKNELGLSNEQSVKMKAINQDFKTKAQAIKANTSLSEEAKKAQLQTLKKQTMSSRQGLLTPDQQKKAAEMKKHHADKKNNTE